MSIRRPLRSLITSALLLGPTLGCGGPEAEPYTVAAVQLPGGSEPAQDTASGQVPAEPGNAPEADPQVDQPLRTQEVIEPVRGVIRLSAGGEIGGPGDFDAALVVRQIRRRLRAIQRCYETELRQDPTLAGNVRVRFTIMEGGTISGARATENTSGSQDLALCVLSNIRRFRFDSGPQGGADFTYGFVFGSR